MSKISRYLLALILVVIVLQNFTRALAGFKSIATAPDSPVAATQQQGPAAAYLQNPSAAQPTQAEISGTSATDPATNTFGPLVGGVPASAGTNLLSGAGLLQQVESGFGQGFLGGL
jgi:hypothetical protein